VRQLEVRYERTAEVALPDLQDTARRLAEAARSDALDTVAARDWRLAAECLWRAEPPLAAEHRFLDAYLRRLGRDRSRAACRRLIRAYLSQSDPAQPAFARVSTHLAEAVQEWGSDRGWLWANSHRRFAIFDPVAAPERLAQSCLATEADPWTVLQEAGLKGDLALAGLAERTYLKALDIARSRIAAQPSAVLVQRILDWSTHNETLAYPKVVARLADALLLPWTKREPPETLRQTIQSFLLEHLGDPRLPQSRPRWEGTSPPARDVITAWLTEQALEMFLGIVDETAEERQWKYRRYFWKAYLDHKHIAQAWVLLGRAGRIEAQRAEVERHQYGRLTGAQGDQAALLIRIGDLTVVDWSHSGACHIWIPGNPAAPRPFEREYRADRIRFNSDFRQVHRPNDGWSCWQGKVADFIRRQTRIQVPPSDYMPAKSPRR
jgi:hypothetical protein